MPNCIQCKKEFSFDDLDKSFFKKFNVSEPKRCHDCRRRLLLSWENELNLYPRKCDLTGVQILSMYPSAVPFPVYKSSEWYSDKWDPLQYGRDFDFSRPFFEQWKELESVVPHPSRLVVEETLTNSDYINYCSYAKNCYLIFDSDNNENCYYSFTLQKDRDVMDSYRTRESELCYECIDCLKCYSCKYCQNVQNSTDCIFGYNLSGCSNCFGCVNLKNAKYCWFNEKLSKEDYEKKIAEIDLGSRAVVAKWSKKFDDYKKKFPKMYMNGISNIDCVGDYLINSKNAIECYDGFRVEDSKYSYSTFLPIKDCYETFECGEDTSKCFYTSVGAFSSYDLKYCHATFESCTNLEYCQHCKTSSDCFGCFGIKKKQYCILNKQYTKEEYFALRTKIVEHMKKTGEDGEFFSPQISPFAYNETLGDIFMPLTKEEAVGLGFVWNNDIKRNWKLKEIDAQDNIKDVDENICGKLLADVVTGQNYKIIKQEFDFYKKMQIPLPDKCFVERHKIRMAKRNPKQLLDGECMCKISTHKDHANGVECKRKFKTTWDPKSKEIIYCRECFLEETI